jgi:outer membrane protein, heavy metal efflux system
MRFLAFVQLFLSALSALTVAACASLRGAPDRVQIDDAIRERTGVGVRADTEVAPLPEGVSLGDGISEGDAVATALWSSPSFRAILAELGIARADLRDAGLLRNPILSLLFPIGPKQLEWTIQFPIDALWQRPRRVATARLNAQAVGQRLVQDGLLLVGDVRRAHAEAVAVEQRLALASENAEVVERIREITEARLRAGDISDLEARTARNDAARAAALVQSLTYDRDASRVALLTLMGVDNSPGSITVVAGTGDVAESCASEVTGLLELALGSRPDVRAAEVAIEAAAERARWERSRVVNLIAMLDANGQGREGFELGPGVSGDLPVFARNQGAISRASSELARATHTYAAVRLRVSSDVRTAFVRFNQARQDEGVWTGDIVPSLETEQRQAEAAYRAGELPLLALLDESRRPL